MTLHLFLAALTSYFVEDFELLGDPVFKLPADRHSHLDIDQTHIGNSGAGSELNIRAWK